LVPHFEHNGHLPEGVHITSWDEFKDRFGQSEHRKFLLLGLEKLLHHLASVGCNAVYVDGSFVSSKEVPEDYDACWDTSGVKIEALDGALLRFTEEGKAKMRDKYGGDIRPAEF
jgi:hypothetical protein